MRHFFAVFAVFAALAWAPRARAAWVELRVAADTATVDVEQDGRAVVSHEMALHVRGGPLKALELAGVDGDAEPLPDATVTPIVRYGIPTPIPLLVERREDGSFGLEIEHPKGLRTGRYVVRLRYATNLMLRDRIRRRGTAVEVEWVGPRFPDGIDVGKAVFRLPPGPTLPTLPNTTDGDESAVIGSAFISTVEHGGGKVAVEIVRPHIAKDEPAVWRLWVSPEAFPGLAEATKPARATPFAPVVAEAPRARTFWLGAALALAAFYAALVALKWSLHARDCRRLSAEPRAWAPLPIGLRAALAGGLFAGAVAIGTLGDRPTLAAVLLLGSIGCASLASPRLAPRPRGPGQWLPLQDDDAFRGRGRAFAGRFFDAGSLPGFLLLALCLGGLGVGAIWLGSRSPYHSLGLLLSGASLVPLFGTGRQVELPVDRAERPRHFLRRLAAALRRGGLRALPWARIPDGESEADELRLLVRVAGAKDGLVALEVGLEHHGTLGGFFSAPFVLLRAREGSRVHGLLPGKLRWQRGRRSDERVAILKPALPTWKATSALVAELAAQLVEEDSSSGPSEARPPLSPTSRTRSRNAWGAPSVTAKLRVDSPAHAT